MSRAKHLHKTRPLILDTTNASPLRAWPIVSLTIEAHRWYVVGVAPEPASQHTHNVILRSETRKDVVQIVFALTFTQSRLRLLVYFLFSEDSLISRSNEILRPLSPQNDIKGKHPTGAL